MTAPFVRNSTREQREEYIKKKYTCKSDCENCGMCKVLKGKTPEIVFKEYMEGKKDLGDIIL